jgi:hypothetical protein
MRRPRIDRKDVFPLVFVVGAAAALVGLFVGAVSYGPAWARIALAGATVTAAGIFGHTLIRKATAKPQEPTDPNA